MIAAVKILATVAIKVTTRFNNKTLKKIMNFQIFALMLEKFYLLTALPGVKRNIIVFPLHSQRGGRRTIRSRRVLGSKSGRQLAVAVAAS